MKELQFLQEFVNSVNETNSKNDKINVIKQYHDKNSELFEKFMQYIFRYDIKFYITSKNLKKRSDLIEECEYDLFGLLDKLKNREITGHKALSVTNGFIEQNSEYEDILYKIIDQKLDGQISVKSINKAVPNCVSVFSVALANKFEEKRIEDNTRYFISQKIDGLRCVVIVDNSGKAIGYSRNGNEFLTIQKVLNEIENLNLKNVVFDGELCIVDENGNEDFQSILKEYNRKNHTIENPMYKIFDYIPLDIFEATEGGEILSERFKQLNNVIPENAACLSVLKQVEFNQEQFEIMQKEAEDKDWEGLILRADKEYKGKRSFDLQKVKKFEEAEYIVEDVIQEVFPILQDNGKYKKLSAVSALIIMHKGNKVQVGSGLSAEQRLTWNENPELIIGKEITVQYFSQTVDQHGNNSLRFPTLKAIYDNGRQV
jgi:DNA ligase-1